MNHSRLASSEILADETGETCVGFYAPAHAFFAAHGIDIQAVMTDNAFAYTNAVVFRQTLLEEWAYVRTYRSNDARSRAFDRFLHTYNHHRPHTSLGSRTSMSRVNNAPSDYI